MDSVEFKDQLAQFAMNPRSYIEEIVSGIFRHRTSRGDQEKIMWNFQGF